RHGRVERPGQQPPDLAGFDLAEHLVAVHPRVRQLGFRYAPDVGDEPAVLRVLDVPTAGQLICFLAVLATALAVPLASDGAVSAPRPADPPASTMLIDARTLFTPWTCCSMPRACIRKLVFAVPHHSAACRIAFSAIPVTSAVFRGAHSFTASAAFSNPTVWLLMNSWSSQSLSIIRCRMPANRAASRPGLTGRIRSQVRASGVIRGSTLMIRAPFSRACQM